MRQIAFRVWHKELHKMFDCYLISFNNGQCGLEGFGMEARERLEIMQFTGCKDRNGKEIYEGDKVIKYFENPKGTPQERRIVVEIPDFYDDWYGLEGEYVIISNVWENSELLSDKKPE